MAYCNRGNAYGNSGKLIEAISDYNKAIELNPKFAMAYYNRGIVYNDSGKIDQAISDYNKAIELNPKDAEAYAYAVSLMPDWVKWKMLKRTCARQCS